MAGGAYRYIQIRNSREFGNDTVHLMQDFDGIVVLPIRWEDGDIIKKLLDIPDNGGVHMICQTDGSRNFIVMTSPLCSKPYPMILIFRYLDNGDEWILIDVDEDDSNFIEYARREYLQESGQKLSLKLNSELTESDAALLNDIGYACEKGTLFEQDFQTAIRMYEMASEAGNPTAKNNLAWMYQNGFGVCKDVPLAVELYKDAAKDGCSAAMVNLGNIYEYGELGEPDYKQCFHWYRAAAAKGDIKGIFNYANCYHWGHGVRKNYKKAFPIFKKLADSGADPNACFYVGLYFQEGKGVKKNYHQALRYYHKGAKNGDAYCYNQLGVLYAEGLGVKKNLRTALKYYHEAAELGDSLAYTNIGWFYEHGDLGKPDQETALKYYQAAADMGDEQGEMEYARLTEERKKHEDGSPS